MRFLNGLRQLVGGLLVTLGVVGILFVGWQVWWTDVVADQDAAQTVAALETGFAEGASQENAPAASGNAPAASENAMPGTEGFAILRVPRFGADFARPVLEGTDREPLTRGVGHYTGTAAPGQVGNFAIAGHRTTYGKPFNRIAELVEGDRVIVETASTFYVYRVTGHEIVAPDKATVLLPVPNRPGEAPVAATLTMTSCHPEFSSRERFVVYATLDAEFSRAEGLPPALLTVGG